MCTIVHYFCAETTDADVFGHGGKINKQVKFAFVGPGNPESRDNPGWGKNPANMRIFPVPFWMSMQILAGILTKWLADRTDVRLMNAHINLRVTRSLLSPWKTFLEGNLQKATTINMSGGGAHTRPIGIFMYF